MEHKAINPRMASPSFLRLRMNLPSDHEREYKKSFSAMVGSVTVLLSVRNLRTGSAASDGSGSWRSRMK
jgi:hypothetical protein